MTDDPPPADDTPTPGGCPACPAYTTHITVDGIRLTRVHHDDSCVTDAVVSDR